MAETTQQNQEKSLLGSRVIWLALILLILCADQTSKWVITEQVMRPMIFDTQGYGLLDWYVIDHARLPFHSIEVTSFFNLVMAWNTGVSFSMFSNQGDYMPFILVIAALLITAIFVRWMFQTRHMMFGISYALVIGGALGNVIDRIRFGAVIDFLDFHALGYHWPAFNVADMSVVSGVCLLIVLSLIFDLNPKAGYREDDNQNTENEASE